MGNTLGAHLCGSVPLADAASVFREASGRMGAILPRIPDGETGERDTWVVWQLPKLQAHPDLETVPPPSAEYGPSMRVQPRAGVNTRSITLGPLGYSDAAISSWRDFSRLRNEGVIAPGTRFQVSLPTPVAVVGAFIGRDQAAFEEIYQERLLLELGEILAEVPADDLAIQWDIAIEFAIFEGVFPSWFGDDFATQRAAVVPRLVRLGNMIPRGVELGYHLCYGDFAHRHFVEPTDTSKLVDIANGIADGLERQLDWLHLPVPRDRTDAEYFAPLRDLELPEATTVYLGLVHATDGVDGGLKRIAAARKVLPAFGIATECGMGRRQAEQIPALMDLHTRLVTLT